MRTRVFRGKLLWMALFPLLGACQPVASRSTPDDRPIAPVHRVSAETPYDTRLARPMTETQLLAKLEGTGLVFLGELHTDPRSHAFQARVVEGLARRGGVAVALEMFSPQADPVLEPWRRGALSEEAFLEQSGWYDNWGYPWPLYRDLFVALRRAAALRGVNLTREERKAVLLGGPGEGLSPALLAEWGPLDLSVQPHRSRFLTQLRGVGHGQGLAPDNPRFQGLYRVQTAWDQAMGARAARLARQTGIRQVIVLAGAGHLEWGLGMDLRAARWLADHPGKPVTQLTVTDLEVSPGGSGQPKQWPVPAGLAPVVRVLPANPQAPRLVSLAGVKFSGGGATKGGETGKAAKAPAGQTPVRVEKVSGGETGWLIRHRAPHLAWLVPGDVILSLNGRPTVSPAQVRLQYEQLLPGTDTRWEIERDGQPMTLRWKVPGETP
ncbi:MAG: ChaN family lipoprotein [Deltaproteobacteria bacterium]|nr:ChaN family lipoprotein [Deltaproteobacteria bacterium]